MKLSLKHEECYSEYTKVLAKKLEGICVPVLENSKITENKIQKIMQPNKTLFIDLKSNQKVYHIASLFSPKNLKSTVLSPIGQNRSNHLNESFHFISPSTINSNSFVKYFMEHSQPSQLSFRIKTDISSQRTERKNSFDFDEYLENESQQYSLRKEKEAKHMRKLILENLESKKKKFRNLNNTTLNNDLNSEQIEETSRDFRGLVSPSAFSNHNHNDNNHNRLSRNNILLPLLQKKLTRNLKGDLKENSMNVIINNESMNSNNEYELSQIFKAS